MPAALLARALSARAAVILRVELIHFGVRDGVAVELTDRKPRTERPAVVECVP